MGYSLQTHIRHSPVPSKTHTRLRQVSVSGLRYYSTATGRWLSPDPIGELGGLNQYTCLQNNPICQTDHLGLQRNVVPPIVGMPGIEFDVHTSIRFRAVRIGLSYPPYFGLLYGLTTPHFPQVRMNVSSDRTCGESGCWRLELLGVYMRVDYWYVWYRLDVAAHERSHVADFRSLIFDRTVAYAFGRAGCYKRRRTAECWEAVAKYYAPSMYFYCGKKESIFLRDGYLDTDLVGPCENATAEFSAKEAECSRLQ
jgi:RHS repeat-associated protein